MARTKPHINTCRNAFFTGETDPTWMRTNDMWPLCEEVKQSLYGYTADFDALLEHKASLHGTASFMDSLSWEKHVYVLHHRSSHCRTSRTVSC